jgi:hypothetical protein
MDSDFEEDEVQNDCGICIEPMNTLSFIQPFVEENEREDMLDETDPLCIRLKCGHAFHFSCQAPAMRLGKFCSLCRDEVKTDTVRQIRIGDEVWEFSGEALNDEIQNLVQSNQELQTALDSEKNNNLDFLQCQRKLSEALTVHKKIANDLKKVRAKFMRDALKSFRSEHKNKFDESKLRIKNLLRKSTTLEEAILRRKGFSSAQIREFFISDPNHDLNELVSNGAVGGDPARHRFWFR